MVMPSTYAPTRGGGPTLPLMAILAALLASLDLWALIWTLWP